MKEKNANINTGTVDADEIERFTRMAGEWWDLQGKFKPLHQINPLRIGFIRDRACAHLGRNPNDPHPLSGLNLLDIGCGGGLIAEPMCRLGAHVTAIDAGEKNIKVARLHAEQSGLTIDYRATSAEDLLLTGAQYDIVLALEIVEHVADIAQFVEVSSKLLKPGGLMVWATLNRTAKSFAFAIIGAEYILRWLPRGTHDWHKFLKPSELCAHLRNCGIEVTEMTGMTMNPLTFSWQLSPQDLAVNYLLVGKKQ